MVAVAILAMAIFGIFHAYSTGFMGMADARERTVASNYAREAMEDIKNMEFELITNENLSAEVTFDGKFKRNVIVSDLEDNLKKVTTRVYWTKRDGNLIDVTTSMMINQMQFNPGDADHILLFAEKYELIIDGTTVITAIIKDANGNTKIDWNEDNDIGFDTDKGAFNVSDISETIKGVATAIYRASDITDDLPTTATITASVNVVDGVPDNTLTLNITDKVSKIELSASPENIWADNTGADGPYESTVTAELLDANDGSVPDATNIITFAISGEGNFVDDSGNILSNLITVSPSSGTGIALIKVQSINNNPGTIIVTASSEGLVSDSITIISLGDPTSISVSIFVSDGRNYIYNDDTDSAIVRVSILDQKSHLIPFGGEISLNGILLEDDTPAGNFIPGLLNFSIEDDYLEAIFTCTDAGTVNITASGTGLSPGSSTIVVKSSLTADSIALSANTTSIPAGGLEEEDASTITATVKSGAFIVENYENQIYFTIITTETNAYFVGDESPFTDNGMADIKLFPASTAGKATIKVSTITPEGASLSSTIEIAFFVDPHHIRLSSDPQNIQVGNKKFELTAIMMDENDAQISNYNESVTFDILFGFPSIIKYQTSNTQSLTTSFSGGKVVIDMKSVNEAGTATIKADSGGILGSLNIPVGIALDLVENSVDSIFDSETGTGTVNFDIDVQGAELKLEEMRVSWLSDDSEVLNKIKINGIEVYSNLDGVSSDTLVDINYNTILSTEISNNVIMYFDTNMSGKSFTVIFNPNSGDYQVEFPVLP